MEVRQVCETCLWARSDGKIFDSVTDSEIHEDYFEIFGVVHHRKVVIYVTLIGDITCDSEVSFREGNTCEASNLYLQKSREKDPVKILVKNEETGDFMIFCSQEDAACALNISQECFEFDQDDDNIYTWSFLLHRNLAVI